MKSFYELHQEHDRLFSVQLFSGLYFQVEYPLHPTTSATVDLAFQPQELMVRQDENGQNCLVAHPPHLAILYVVSNLPDMGVAVTLARSQTATADFRPFNWLSFQTKLVGTLRRGYTPTIGTSFSFPFAHIGARFSSANWRNCSTADLISTIGTETSSLSIQSAWFRDKPRGFALMHHFQRLDTLSALAVVFDREFQFIWSLQRKFSSRWKVGLKLAVTQKLHSDLLLAWRAKIGKFTLHSSCNIDEVKSHMRYDLSERCQAIFTSWIKHSEHSFRFGMALTWHQPV
jgi:hypothetical protein